MLTNEQLAEIRERHDCNANGYEMWISVKQRHSDITALLVEVSELRRWKGEAVEMLEVMQCAAEDGGCVCCSVGVSNEECTPGCPLAALLQDAEKK